MYSKDVTADNCVGFTAFDEAIVGIEYSAVGRQRTALCDHIEGHDSFESFVIAAFEARQNEMGDKDTSENNDFVCVDQRCGVVTVFS